MSGDASTTLPGIVDKIIKPVFPDDPEKAQITVETAEHLYKEIRIDNELTDDKGNPVHLKPGARVEVTVEAAAEAVRPGKTKSGPLK